MPYSFTTKVYAGLRITEAHAALMETDERTFPVSRHRSARIHKKLVKRYGGEFKKVPTAYRVGDEMIIHPALMAQLRAELTRSIDEQFVRTLYGG